MLYKGRTWCLLDYFSSSQQPLASNAFVSKFARKEERGIEGFHDETSMATKLES